MGLGAPRTNGGGCRPGGDAGWQFQPKAVNDGTHSCLSLLCLQLNQEPHVLPIIFMHVGPIYHEFDVNSFREDRRGRKGQAAVDERTTSGCVD
jgi:hypothetical protein